MQKSFTGVDRVTLTAPVRGAGRLRDTVDVGGAKVHVETYCARTGSRMARINFNPSRVVHPDTYVLATFPEAQEAIRHVWDVITGIVEPIGTVNHAGVSLLHLARDFVGATDPSAIIMGMGQLYRPRGGASNTWHNPKTNTLETLDVGPRDNRIVLYRKDLDPKARGAVPENLLRCESRLGRRPLRGNKVSTFYYLTDDHIDLIAHNRWLWSGMGTTVTTGQDLYDMVVRSTSGWTTAKRAGLLWDLESVRHGTWPTDRRRRTRAMNWIADHGLPAAGASSELVVAQTLDWDTGTVLVATDAVAREDRGEPKLALAS